MTSYLFDTCFLIDLQREMNRTPGKAHHFLQNHSAATPYLSWIAAGEFAEGFGSAHHPACREMLARFELLPMDLPTVNHYAMAATNLRESGMLIGANDLWIAACAMSHQLALVTNNSAHFHRVAGLSVMSY